MRSYLEALAEGAWENKDIAPRFLMVTQNETERMIRLVNDLLQLSKFDSKDYQFNREWIHMIRFMSLIIDRFEMTKEQHVEFIRELPDRNLYVEIDQDKVTQVLDNIISNALKYSPEGGHVTFSVDVNEKEELLYISVKDEGIGIPKKMWKKSLTVSTEWIKRARENSAAPGSCDCKRDGSGARRRHLVAV